MKGAEEKLKQEKELFDQIINSLPGLFYLSDLTPRLLKWNKKFEKVSGYSAEELGNIIPITLFEPGDHSIVRHSLDKTYKEGSSEVEATLITKNGLKIPYYFTWVRIMYEGNPAIVGSGIDISERKKAEKTLSDSNQRYKNLIDNINDGLIVDDISGKITFANQNFLDMFGITADELSFFFLEDYVAPEYHKKLRERHNRRMAREKVPAVFEYEGVRKNGERIWIETHVRPISENGIFTGSQSILRDITERKNSEQEIRKSNERFELIGKATNDALWDWDIETNKGWGNEIHQQLYGLTLGDPVPDNEEWERRIHPEDRDRIVEMLKKAMFSVHEAFIEEYRFYTENKGWINVYGRTHIERDMKGNPVRLVGSMMDITESKKAAEKLGESEEKYRQIVETSQEGIWMIDEEGYTTFVNERIAIMLGHNKKEMIGKHLFDFMDDEGKEIANSNMQRRKERISEDHEFKFIKKDGSVIWTLLSTSPVEKNGKYAGALAMVIDITERKKAEEEKYLLQDSLQKSLNEIYLFDPDTLKFKYINAGALKNLGYSLEEMKKLTPIDIKPAFTKQSFKELLNPLINREQEKIVFFTDHKRKDGSLYPAEVHLQLIRQENSNVFLAVVLDLTERKKIEEELLEQRLLKQKLITETTIRAQEKERNELGKELHDNINQILSTIKMYLGVVRSGLGNREEMIEKSHEYMNEVILEIRKLSHSLVAPSLGDIGLKAALNEIAKETNLLKDLQIKLVVEKNYNEKDMDKDKKLMFYRIVQEQINNIIKHACATEVIVELRNDKNNYFLSIADNGKGFDPSQISKGIGLQNINSRVEFYSGNMNIISVPGRGCTLEINIPF